MNWLRYAIALVCYATSAGCLVLWGRSYWYFETWSRLSSTGVLLRMEDCIGFGRISLYDLPGFDPGWGYHSSAAFDSSAYFNIDTEGAFGLHQIPAAEMHFPLWYPALVFALAAVAAIRFGKRFTLRSAIAATTVVAGLLGIVVAF
ncbi:hypothetical protein [Lacipirellula sp.]|uniref:hypothetical protein n=1 Tax=Lacipirellula sp. TaxID=2691419 RepID=UPI003D11F7D6